MNKTILLILKQFQENLRSDTPRCRILGHSSDMQIDAWIHREDIKIWL